MILFSTILYVVVSLALISYGMKEDKFKYIGIGAFLLIVLLFGRMYLYGVESDLITVLEPDIFLTKYEISDDENDIRKAYELNETVQDGKVFPIINEKGETEYKFIEYGDNVEIIKNIENGYIEEYTTKEVATVNKNKSKFEKFLITVTTFKNADDIEIVRHKSSIYYKVNLN